LEALLGAMQAAGGEDDRTWHDLVVEHEAVLDAIRG